MKDVFAASSALDIYRGQADLSRRIMNYSLPGLSFWEYLKFTGIGNFPAFTLTEIWDRHREITQELTKRTQ